MEVILIRRDLKKKLEDFFVKKIIFVTKKPAPHEHNVSQQHSFSATAAGYSECTSEGVCQQRVTQTEEVRDF
jgi:hypothetical protein